MRRAGTSTVTQTFQQHVDRARANNWQYYYGGIDWAVATGTPVKAAQAGTVTDVWVDRSEPQIRYLEVEVAERIVAMCPGVEAVRFAPLRFMAGRLKSLYLGLRHGRRPSQES